MEVKKFRNWSINELQSSEAPIKSDGGEPSYSYGNIQDILGNKYNFSVKTEKLKEYEENVLSKDKTENKNDEYFAKSYIEFNRKKFRLTPPFQDDLIQNNDFYVRAFQDEMNARNSQNDTGKPIKGLQETHVNEDGVANAGGANVSGMGAVVTSQPSSIPGDASGATTGSGDIGSGWNRNVISRPTGSRRKNKMKATAKAMSKKFANQFNGDEYKKGGDKNAHIMSFSDYKK